MILLLLLACGADKSASDDTSTAEVEAAPVEEPLICASPDLSMEPSGEGWALVTEHYALQIEGFDEEETAALGALAETAWEGLAAFFGAELAGPLDVRIAADQAGFVSMLAEDGLSGLDSAGGYYDPNTGRAYLYRQPTAYYSRVLMLHELVHQYQDQAEGISDLPGWYVEGLAEALGRHHWDGSCLQLRVRPLLSWEDMAAQAQAELDGGALDLESVLAGGDVSRPLAQELLRLLAGDPKLAPGFSDWRAAVAAGSMEATDTAAFATEVAPIDEIATALAEFVPTDQEPMAPIYYDWIPESADGAYGFAEASSAVRVKGEVIAFAMTVAAPVSGSVGTVYGYDPETGDLELALLSSDGSVSRFAVVGGVVSWDIYGAVSLVDTVSWSQLVGDDLTVLLIDDAEVELPRALPPAGGLALYGAEASFSDLLWE